MEAIHDTPPSAIFLIQFLTIFLSLPTLHFPVSIENSSCQTTEFSGFDVTPSLYVPCLPPPNFRIYTLQYVSISASHFVTTNQ